MFGNMIIGSSSKGVCHLMFYQDIHEALRGLQQQFLNAQIIVIFYEQTLEIINMTGVRQK